MKALVKWVDEAMFVAESGSGHAIVIDGPESVGGRNMGVRPMELMLMGVGGCSSADVVMILKNSNQKVTSCRVEVEAERADAVPAVFTKIHLKFLVSGEGLRESIVKRAVEMSASKYCSASIMMAAAGAEVTHSYEVIE